VNDVTSYARQGWQMVSGNPHLWSSDAWLAFEAGAQAHDAWALRNVFGRVNRAAIASGSSLLEVAAFV
jgi:hypothetical protein